MPRFLVLCASDRRGTLLSNGRSTAGEKVWAWPGMVRKTSLNNVVYVSTSGLLGGSDGKSGSASQCLSIVELPDCQGQYRIFRRSSVTYECKRCRISVSMSDHELLTRRCLLILEGQISTNKSSTSLRVTAQVCLSFMDPSPLSITLLTCLP